MYVTINDVIGEKRIDLSYPVKSRDGSAEEPCGPRVAQRPQITVVSMFSNDAQYWLQGTIEVLLKTGRKIVLNKAVYMDKELNALIGLELKLQMMGIPIMTY